MFLPSVDGTWSPPTHEPRRARLPPLNGVEVDLTAIVAIWTIGVIILVPIAGVTLRYGVLPVLAILAELRTRNGSAVDRSALVGRVASLEERLRRLEATPRTEPWRPAESGRQGAFSPDVSRQAG